LRAMEPPALPGDMFSFAAMLVDGLDRDAARQWLRDRDTARKGRAEGDSPILRVRKIGTVPERAATRKLKVAGNSLTRRASEGGERNARDFTTHDSRVGLVCGLRARSARSPRARTVRVLHRAWCSPRLCRGI